MFGKLQLVIFAVLLYAYIFQPFIGKYMYVGIEALIVLLFLLSRGYKRIFSTLKIEIILLSVLVAYSLFLDTISDEIVYTDRFAACLLQGTFMSYILTFYIQKNQYLRKNFENVLVLIAVIGCSITLLMIINPSFNNLIQSFTPENEEFYDRFGEDRYRLYGLSENLSFTYPYVLAVVGYYAIIERESYISIPLTLMVFVAIIFNARIGFIPLFLTAVYFLLFGKKNGKRYFLYPIVIVVLLFLIIVVFSEYRLFNNSWGLSFFDEIPGLLRGEESSTYDTLTGRMFFIPDQSIFDFLFGTGVSAYRLRGHNSDVGYVLQMYYGGLFLLLFILALMFYMSRRIIKIAGKQHWFSLIYILSLFILNFKGFYFASTPGFRFLSLLYVYYLMNGIRSKRVKMVASAE